MDKRISHDENALAKETSPYLLQHARNPVDWHAWNPDTLEKARKEDKVILVSIGYSSCHWCHVMEHESFEDKEVAGLMNENFICIKVDREERPDVDQVYMDAVHLVGGRGGWPLNCFALPDGRPFWGATYFPKMQWLEVLKQINRLYQHDRNKLEQQAADIAGGIEKNEFISPVVDSKKPDLAFIEEIVANLSLRFDNGEGGSKGSPKFPMPNNYLFLLRFVEAVKNSVVLEHVELTLTKMASGGIYDQAGGGFSRYSVDDHWHIPHFEKMLYDNAQLVSLYSEAFMLTNNELYGQVITETLEFINREMTSPEGAFYSSLDADSEGEEGKFYVWTEDEIDASAGKDKEIVTDYFGIGRKAMWEEDKNVLIRATGISELSEKYSLTSEEIEKIIADCRTRLLQKRSKRVRPGLDDKILTSWNALMIKGYADAFRATRNERYREIAVKNALFILSNLKKKDGGLYHNHKNGISTINGFLDDYAFVIEAFITLFQVTGEVKWLAESKTLMEYVLARFFDRDSGLFYFTSDENRDLFIRKIELMDNVIPSANSSIAHSLFILGHCFEESSYRAASEKMFSAVRGNLPKYPSAFSNWSILALRHSVPFYTVVVCGKNALQYAGQLDRLCLPNIFVAPLAVASDLPLFHNRFPRKGTLIYVCSEGFCQYPVETVDKAYGLIAGNTSD